MTNSTQERQDTKIFQANNLDDGLRECQSEGYRVLFMPELADARMEAEGNSELWQNWFSTPSLRATGKTNAGSPVVVYAHVDNYFSNPDNIETARKDLVRGAGRLPQEEFQRLIDLAEQGNQGVILVPYEKLRKSPSGVIPVDDALEHPQTIAFLGGQERAEKYLEKHKEVYGNRIGVWHTNDLKGDQPLGRLLFVGSDCSSGLDDSNDLYDDACFVGVRRGESAEGAVRKNSAPSLEETLATVAGEFGVTNPGELRKALEVYTSMKPYLK